ncbi:Dabb family protein [soil metagenome]
MLKHIVIWKIAGETPAAKLENSAKVSAALMTLPSLISEIISMNVASNGVAIDHNGDLVLIAEFEDEAGLQTYVAHPEHVKVVGQIKQFLAERAAIDILE